MKFKFFVKKISCFLLNHKWGKSEYLTENSCEIKVICLRCGEFHQSILHEIKNEKFKKIDDTCCTRISKCERCKNIEELKRSHDFAEIKKEIIDTEIEIIPPVNVDHRTQKERDIYSIVEKCRNCGFEKIYQVKGEVVIVSY